MTVTQINRRRALALLAAPALVHLLASCTSDTTRGGGADSDVAKSGLQRISVPVDEAKAAAAAINDFAEDLYRFLVADDPHGNVVFSPASVAVAMVMAAAGGAGVTAAEIYDTLYVADQAVIDRAMNALSAHLTTLDQSSGSGDDKREVRLSIANSLWGQRGVTFETAYLDLLAEQYAAQMNLVDYKGNAKAAVKRINSWVDEATEQRIPHLLGDTDVTEDTRLVLVNAIYLLATWASTFDKEDTRTASFTTAAGAPVDVDMMHQRLNCGYSKGPGWQAIQLPYSFDELAFTAVLPDEVTEESFDIAEIHAEMYGHDVILGLPKFDFETRTQLGDTLQALGIRAAFGRDADFSKMTTQERLMISKVIHQANITVDERGTEAAAATAVVVDVMSAPAPQPEQPIEITFDRPFTFWITDLTSGAVIFTGRVADPSQIRT